MKRDSWYTPPETCQVQNWYRGWRSPPQSCQVQGPGYMGLSSPKTCQVVFQPSKSANLTIIPAGERAHAQRARAPVPWVTGP